MSFIEGTGLYTDYLNDFICYNDTSNELQLNVNISGCNSSWYDVYASNLFANNATISSIDTSNLFAINIDTQTLYTNLMSACNGIFYNVTVSNTLVASNIESIEENTDFLNASNLTAYTINVSNLTGENASFCNIDLNGSNLTNFWSANSNNVYMNQFGEVLDGSNYVPFASNLCLGQSNSACNWQLDVLGTVNYSYGDLCSNNQPIAFINKINLKEKNNNKSVVAGDPDDDLVLPPAIFPFIVGGLGIWSTAVTTCNVYAANGDFGDLSASNLTVNGKPLIGSQWVDCSNGGIFYSSNVGIGVSNPIVPLQVQGNILSTGLQTNTLIAANSLIQNSVNFNEFANNLTAAQGTLQNITCVNGLFSSITGNSALFGSITSQSLLNVQLINQILKSSSNSSVQGTVAWQNVNTSFTGFNIYLTVTQQLNSELFNGTRTEQVVVNSLVPVSCLVNMTGVGNGAYQVYSGLSLQTVCNSNSVTVVSQTSLGGIINNNLNLCVTSTCPFLGNIILS